MSLLAKPIVTLGMSLFALATASPAVAQSGTSEAVALQGLPKLPQVDVPKIQVRKSRVEASSTTSAANRAGNDRELQREYSKEVDLLAYPINTNWSSQADNARIELAVAEYRDRVARVAGQRYAGLSQEQRDEEEAALIAYYDRLEATADRSIAWAQQQIGKIGVADAAYNEMLVLEAAMYGAVTLYPSNPRYASAKSKVDAVLARFGSREGANEAKDAAILAEAAKVSMPPAIDTSAGSVQQFRQAWATGGIPGTIRKIHITSGWGVKRDALGRVIGRTRDAAIAVEDPQTGHCNLYDFTMIVEPGGSPRRSSHTGRRMLCENIDP